MKTTLLTIILSLFCISVFAQTGIVKGKITESGSGTPLEFVNILVEGTTIGGQTDEKGEFEITGVTPGTYNLKVTSVGYKAKTVFEIELTNAKPAVVAIELEPASEQLEEVEIKAAVFNRPEESPVSLRSIGVNEIQRYPGGNRDISKVIQSLPGVGFTSSFRNDILIRGGSPSENRFYIDGIEIPNINHFATQGASGGPVGLINVDLIREVNFYSGAFPANRGNTLSSVMDIRLRDGREDRFGLTATLGSSEFALSMESPLDKQKKATALVSVRHSYLQWLFQALQLPFLPTYTDAQFKIKYKIDKKNEIIFLGLGAYDQFKLNLKANKTEEQRYLLKILPTQGQWNYSIGTKYTHYFDDKYLNIILSRSMLNNQARKYVNNDENQPITLDYASQESENKFRLEVTGRKDNWKYNYGVYYEFARYTNRSSFQQSLPGTQTLVSVNFESKLLMHKWGFFTQVSRSFFKDRLNLSLGLRGDMSNYNTKMLMLHKHLSPRFSASVSLLPGWLLNFNTGYYNQLPPYTALGFEDNNNNLVNKPRLDYITNVHVVLGTEYQTKWNGRFSVEGFFKQYYNYPFLLQDSISFANVGSNFGVVGNEPAASINKGRTYGAEFLYEQKLYKGWYGIVAYTIFWSEFQDKNGKYVPSSWDSRHVISLTGGKKFKKGWEVGARWRISGGQPYTPYDVDRSSIVAVWDVVNQGLPDYNRLNTERLPWFHQLDIRVTKKWFFKKWSFELYLDVQNAYAFKAGSPPSLDLVYDGNTGAPLTIDGSNPQRYQTKLVDTRSGFPIPTLGFVIYY